VVTNGAGFSLIETTIALALTAAIAASVSTALAASRAAGAQARAMAIEVVAARSRLAELGALRYEVAMSTAGVATAVTDVGLTPTTADALWSDRAGCVDYLDATGAAIGADAAAAARAAYVRRWSIGRHGSGPGEAVLLAVLVAPVAVDRRVRALGDTARLVDQPEAVVVRGALARQAS
jgi:hypothetical protein